MTKPRSIYRWPWLALRQQRAGKLELKAPPTAALPDRALTIWQERRDLQAEFDLSDENGRAGLFWWCLLHGFRELGLRFDRNLDKDFFVANEPLPAMPEADVMPITWLMRALWANSTYRAADLADAQERYNCIAHYFAHALLDANLGWLLTEEQARLIRSPDPQTNAPLLCAFIWHCDPELAKRFDDPSSREFVNWCTGEGARNWPILAHPLVNLAPVPQRRVRSGPLKGVNLFGHALGRFGIGEDVRMAARTLDAAGIPYVIRNVGSAADVDLEKPDDLKLSDTSPYDVNLFCMTGVSTLGAQIASREDVNEGRHTIGMWPWELPEWPQSWDQAWDCVDEVWAASHFTYAAFMRAARAPIHHMPMAVVVDSTEQAQRSDFGLPESDFLFGFSFDGLSSLARKNPRAVVEAFRRAFPPDREGVGLVLKGIRGDTNAPAWRSLLEAIGDDNRIYLINDSFSRGRLLDLYRAMDSFVSLHRSEGFGRNIAEAMLLGKPVIVTAHSGNLDFTNHSNAALVPTKLREVQEGEYPFGAGQSWGDPDAGAAGEAMSRMVEDRTWREDIASRGQAYIERGYAPEAVAEAWSRRLKSLAEG